MHFTDILSKIQLNPCDLKYTVCCFFHSCVIYLIDVVHRDRETERQRDRETERQRDRETERQRDRETERQRDRETERQRDRETEIQRDRDKGKKEIVVLKQSRHRDIKTEYKLTDTKINLKNILQVVRGSPAPSLSWRRKHKDEETKGGTLKWNSVSRLVITVSRLVTSFSRLVISVSRLVISVSRLVMSFFRLVISVSRLVISVSRSVNQLICFSYHVFFCSFSALKLSVSIIVKHQLITFLLFIAIITTIFSRHDGGHYRCIADNGFGQEPVTKEVKLEVHRKYIHLLQWYFTCALSSWVSQ